MRVSSDPPLTMAEKVGGKQGKYALEGIWPAHPLTLKFPYKPEYCKQLVEYFCKRLADEAASEKKVAPPHVSQFARMIGVPTKVMQGWADLFTDFEEAYGMAMDIQREMLIDGSLLGKYSGSIAKVLLDYQHGIREKQEIKVEDLRTIPMETGGALNYILKQHGLPPVEIEAEDAEFEDKGPRET